jgi:hypothetical protein
LFGGYLTNCIDTIITDRADSSLFESKLNYLCEVVQTKYSCLFMSGRVISKSKYWSELKANETYLVSLVCLTMSYATTRDIPIYLPNKNPHV